jgi:hypothetical protein
VEQPDMQLAIIHKNNILFISFHFAVSARYMYFDPSLGLVARSTRDILLFDFQVKR